MKYRVGNAAFRGSAAGPQQVDDLLGGSDQQIGVRLGNVIAALGFHGVRSVDFGRRETR